MASTCLPPIAKPDARVLILGSLPGQASLKLQQYYAHPRNQFWPILGQLFEFPANAPYPERLQHALRHRIALWDVCAQAQRPGSSLDSAIRNAVANDFPSFLAAHPHINLIACNGGKAFNLFRRLAAPHLTPAQRSLVRQLPSTSPAHAGMTFEQKLAQWRVVREAQMR